MALIGIPNRCGKKYKKPSADNNVQFRQPATCRRQN